MSTKHWAYIFMALGIVILLSRWNDVIGSLGPATGNRPQRVLEWSWSGSPEIEKRRAADFMKVNPDVRVELEFREANRLQDTVYVSFLSGSPPDLMYVGLGDLRDLVAGGMLRPMDDLLEGAIQRRPDFMAQLLDGESARFLFQANPDDPFIRQKDKYPLEAARLLKMHGRFVGFTSSSGINTLTYNRRLFRAAAAMFPDAGLVDAHGQAVPPVTWADLLLKAKLITEYGRRSGEGCYGITVQGRTPKDFGRGVFPLAATAGSRGFDFRGRKLDGVDQPMGCFDYDSPAIIAAFKLMMLLKADGSILPGTSSRVFEDARTTVGDGRAAMIIDGWHAALIAGDRVPWAKEDMGSAAIPVPYEVDSPQTAAQKAQLEAMLGMTVGRGVWPRGDASMTTCVTSGAKHPQAVWNWMFFGFGDLESQKRGSRRGSLPPTRAAAARINDPEWYPLPYQKQAWGVYEQCKFWPQPPNVRIMTGLEAQDIMHQAFLTQEISPGDSRRLSAVSADVAQGLTDYTARLNRELVRRVKSGEDQPRMWTFPSFDPLKPDAAYQSQRMAGADPVVTAQVEALKAQLPEVYRKADTYQFFRFETSASSYSILWVPGILLLLVGAFFLSVGLKSSQGHTVPLVAREARANWFAYALVLPGVLGIVAFAIYPSIYQFYLSLHEGSGITPMQYVGLKHFGRIFNFLDKDNWDRAFWTTILPNTALYMVVVTSFQVSLGLLIANLLNLPLKVNRVVSMMFFIPMAVSLAAVAVVFLGLLGGANSGLNGALETFGLKRLPLWLGLEIGHDWLGQPQTDLYAIMLVGIWHGLPYNTILLLAGLQSVDPQLHEAGRIDGAGAWQRFRHITLPELAPILIVIVFNALVSAARVFGPVFILTEGGKNHSSEVVSTYIFKKAFTKPPGQQPDIGYGSALGIVYALILAGLTIFNVIVIARRWRRRMEAEKRGGAPAPVEAIPNA